MLRQLREQEAEADRVRRAERESSLQAVLPPTPEKVERPRKRRDRLSPRRVRIGDRVMWQVELGSEIRDGRRCRLRRTFADRKEAETFSELKRVERDNYGSSGIALDQTLRGEALEARRVLSPYGVSILDAARDYVKRAALLATSETVSNAVSSLVASKRVDGLRPRYLRDLHDRLRRFELSFGPRKLADIQSAEIDRWLRELGLAPLTRNSFRMRIYTLFEYARRCGWVSQNPVEDVRKVKVREGVPGILEPIQIARILENASPETLPFFAIGAFAGLRTTELQRLEWRDVRFDEGLIEVRANSSKTASRRFAAIRSNLAGWLAPFRGRVGKVCPPDLYERTVEDRKRAGILVWPSNCLRHSFASYHLAAFSDLNTLTLEMGHVNSAILFKHYRKLVTPAVAAEFWRIAPRVEGDSKLRIVA
jgi:integrase